MILTCPECATSYFVDDLRVPRGGRMVKCTSCGNRWRAFQDRSGPETPEPEPRSEAPPPLLPPVDELEIAAGPIRPARKPPAKKTPVGLYVGAGVAAALILGLGGAVVLRQQVVKLAPATAPLFAIIGLPVNTLGLVIEGVKWKPTFQAGRPVLSVTGAIRSVNKVPTEAPTIRINLLDKEGKALAGIRARPLNAKIPPGATRYFAVTMADPPSGSHDLELAFEAPEKDAHAAPAHAAQVAAPHGPAPVEAKPLPADAPDALKSPAAAPHEQH